LVGIALHFLPDDALAYPILHELEMHPVAGSGFLTSGGVV
jgi:hypothetical protein